MKRFLVSYVFFIILVLFTLYGVYLSINFEKKLSRPVRNNYSIPIEKVYDEDIFEYVKHIIIQNNNTRQIGRKKRFIFKDLELDMNHICERDRWQHIQRPCLRYISWTSRLKSRLQRTDLYKSRVILNVLPPGYPSSVEIITFNSHGIRKTYGGDYWRIKLKGTDFVAAVIMHDDLDGTYRGLFTLPKPGIFHLKIALEHSACQGLVDTPLDWFKNGSEHGKFQAEGSIKYNNDFLNHMLQDIYFEVYDPFKTLKMSWYKNDSISTSCGYWLGDKFHSYLPSQNKAPIKVPTRFGRLLVYGDSMAVRLFKSIEGEPICHDVFTDCVNHYLWIYKHYYGEDIWKYDHRDFNESRWLNEIITSLTQKSIMNTKSVFLVNFGVHIVMTLPLYRGIRIFHAFIKTIEDLRRSGKNLPYVIWKNTTPPQIETTTRINITHMRFLTKHRVAFWNSYTTSELLKHEIPVLDAHDLAISCPIRGNVDHVHFENFVFKNMERKLLEHVLENHRRII